MRISIGWLGGEKTEGHIKLGFDISGGTEQERYEALKEIQEVIININRYGSRPTVDGNAAFRLTDYIPTVEEHLAELFSFLEED